MTGLLDIPAILLGLAALFGALNYWFVKLPHTIGLVVIALVASLAVVGLDLVVPTLGLSARVNGFLESLDFNVTLMQGMLSFLLFAGALHVDLGQLLSRKWTILVLASFGVVLSSLIIGGGFWLTATALGLSLPLIVCLVLGVIVTPTDPVAVLGLLKTLKVPAHLKAKIAGESLFNDGVAVVLFSIVVLLAFGGGVVGDLAGYVAASLLRGIDFIQVPTTLLAQVDSSVGGKTGINSASGKNLVGAFHQPRAVYIDTDLLATLSSREWRAGYAEVAKYGCLWDGAFFEWLESEGPVARPDDPAALEAAITRSCAIKADVVAQDEREAGLRGLLNLGHTFGHALEAIYGFDGRLLHGEAVSVGIGLAYELGRALGLSTGQDASRVKAHLRAAGLPVDRADLAPETFSLEDIWAPMMKDKKVRDGIPTFIVPNAIGRTHLNRDVPKSAVDQVLNHWMES
ncbi:MAG: 3-dehydroquinate synthase [Alphaproteobacteria bacterium]